MNRILVAVTLSTLAASAAAQSPPAELSLDGSPLASPRATLDPVRALQLEGEADGRLQAFRLRFPRLSLPAPGRHELSALAPDNTVRAQRRTEGGYVDLLNGELEVTAFGADRVAGRLSFLPPGASTTHQLVFDLVPRVAALQSAVVRGAGERPGFTVPGDLPASEDLVFCAVGGTGTGMPGARQVAGSIAELATSGPLDFVILMGNNISPRGVESAVDPQWGPKFENVFDRARLPMPFYAVYGVDDLLGSPTAQVEYGVMSPRWTMPARGYTFDFESHGATFTFVALDTVSLLGDLATEGNRDALRAATKVLMASEATWKVAFGYHAIATNGRAYALPGLAVLEERVGRVFYDAGVDVYVAGDGRALELIGTRNGTLHVLSGAGGGAEMAESLDWREDTLFAHTGGGFVWFRYDGKALEISYRGADGEVLYAHRVRKVLPVVTAPK